VLVLLIHLLLLVPIQISDSHLSGMSIYSVLIRTRNATMGMIDPTFFYDEESGNNYLFWKEDGNGHNPPGEIPMKFE
jgi:hypothetical protein